jgi:hypothetical protein
MTRLHPIPLFEPAPQSADATRLLFEWNHPTANSKLRYDSLKRDMQSIDCRKDGTQLRAAVNVFPDWHKKTSRDFGCICPERCIELGKTCGAWIL